GLSTAVHIFLVGYRAEDKRFPRFFTYLGLFCFSMLGLVLGGTTLQLFIFWELVGLCSYLLIGFWYEKKSASNAAIKAFVTNRVGDFGFLIGFGIPFYHLGNVTLPKMWQILATAGAGGPITLTMSALIAVAQTDIKRVLAYSTLSQLGYMILALGLGSWVGGLFHLITHAFFKALLFLGSGSVIDAAHHEQELPQYGGLIRKIPMTGITFGIAVFAIAGTPGFAGYYSKDMILAHAASF